jgi:hypothetical protein
MGVSEEGDTVPVNKSFDLDPVLKHPFLKNWFI